MNAAAWILSLRSPVFVMDGNFCNDCLSSVFEEDFKRRRPARTRLNSCAGFARNGASATQDFSRRAHTLGRYNRVTGGKHAPCGRF
jgi:hypothetical protein